MNASNLPLPRILVIDDAAPILADFRKILCPASTALPGLRSTASALFGDPEPSGTPAPSFAVDCASQGEEGLALLQRALAEGRPYAAAFVDMRMPPGWDGLETIRHLWAADPSLQVVICTAYSDYSWEQVVRSIGQSDSLLFLKKPFDNIEVLQLAHALTKKWEVTRRDRDRLAQLDEAVRTRTAELRAAEERFSQAFNACPLPQAIQDLETGEVLEINTAHESSSGLTRTKILGLTPETCGLGLDPLRWRGLLTKLKSGETIDEWPFTFRGPVGPPREFRCSGRAVTIAGRPCAVWVFRDVTDQIHLEQQFRQAQKMEAVGQLAAGVAHDFNNLLTVILSYTSFALEDSSVSEPHRTGLSQVCAAAQRAAALTRQLLVFSRRQITNPEPLDLGETLTNLRKMLDRLLPERITLEWQCSPDLPLVTADAANLEQIVMNLVVNARDAIPAAGKIRLGLRAITLHPGDTGRHPDARAGRFVCLTVADNGTGMDESVLARIFEPFFTTKNVGEGTGLGLSTVYGIVHQHEGWIEVDSTPNAGTTFSVFFPAIADQVSPAVVSPADGEAGSTSAGRGEHILLAEDEPFVRETAHLVATRAGYRVTLAVDGPSAIRAWSTTTVPFDLLLTDMVMPNGMTGAELAAKLRAENPRLKVVLSTGYSNDLLEQGAQALEGARLLLKPYDSTELLQALREALDARPAPAAEAPPALARPLV